MNLYEKLAQIKLIPVVVINDAANAVPLAQALAAGGLNCAEITLRTPQALDAIQAIHQAMPDMLLGAGTVLTTDQADQAIDAGASFLVSPGLNPDVVKHAQKRGIPMLPGAITPTEVEAGLSLGLTHLKFFPAEAAGGVAMLKALAGPYGQVKFMPTGGISQKNLQEYLALKNVFACGGSFMVTDQLIENGDFAQITALCKGALSC